MFGTSLRIAGQGKHVLFGGNRLLGQIVTTSSPNFSSPG
jgi:hypothetical protein